MASCFFVSDLHGSKDRFEKLFDCIEKEKPDAVFIGGDVLPSGLYAFTSAYDEPEVFANDFLATRFTHLKKSLKASFPFIFLIMGNDDGRVYEPLFYSLEKQGFFYYMHERKRPFLDFDIYGYTTVPPTPFTLKDWEKYDVSRYVDPGCIPPEEGAFTVDVNLRQLPYETIQKDLEKLTEGEYLGQSIFLFHTPPYQTKLDRAGLDGKFYEHVPLDVHVGSIAVKRFIEERQPAITLHGHIHESTSITGAWEDRIGETVCLNASHDGPELALIRFDPYDMSRTSRELL
ncbi:MAG: metallophosphoesterase [bacterium]|jgi:uncharacterized protein